MIAPRRILSCLWAVGFITTHLFRMIDRAAGWSFLTLVLVLCSTIGLRGETTRIPYGPPLPGSEVLTWDDDPTVRIISGVHRFLSRELEAAVERRPRQWARDYTSIATYNHSVATQREQFARIIGVRDSRVSYSELELVATQSESGLVGKGDGYDVYAIRWPVLDGVHGEGLLLKPTRTRPRAVVIALGDCEQLPEALVGLEPGVPLESQMARRLAESGCLVIVPLLVDRGNELSTIAGGRRKSTVHHREFIYRAAYQMGRHIIGYEVQKILSLVDLYSRSSVAGEQRIGVIGYAEGGLLALYSAAIDPRITVAGVSGYFNSRQQIWREPIDRNVFGLLTAFGDAEIASLVGPRPLVIEACVAPTIRIPPGGQSAPAECTTPSLDTVRAEVDRARNFVSGLNPPARIEFVESGDGVGPSGTRSFLEKFLRAVDGGALAPLGAAPQNLRPGFVPAARKQAQFRELMEFSERLVEDGPQTRFDFFSRVERRNGIPAFRESTKSYRHLLRDQIIGDFDRPLSAAAPKSRQAYDDPKFRGYEVVLEVFGDVQLYGVLLVPKDLKSGEKRPVVVCQHGLEGRAEFTVMGDQQSYRDFAARLARRGFITFSPQHLYRGGDDFRTLQRQANPLGKSLFSVMIAQHRQLLAWLGQQDFVDPERIAFYGISYGGKSAMRIPAILEGYALSICSSDFSDWIWRTVSNKFENGYLGHSEYEIFEFDLGNKFNYGEMAALICPRPFMVEEFHQSGLFAERNRAEFARVQLLYENLGLPDRVRLSYYGASDPSTPYVSRPTFDFLHEHLRWPHAADSEDGE